MTNYDDWRKEALSDPEVLKEYYAQKPEFDLVRELYRARLEANMSQAELAEKSGVTQADISRIEKGKRNPSIEVFARLLYPLGKMIYIGDIKYK